MDEGTAGYLAFAVAVASVASCTAAQSFISSAERSNMSPAQECVRRAWTQAERIECLKANTPEKPKGKP